MTQSVTYDVVIIGGGAAGFFCACKLQELLPDSQICLLEKSSKVLSKVKISGGGRCNVTHNVNYNSELVKHYPNGKNFLKRVFKKFSVSDTIEWFNTKGVKLKAEHDGRMFPITDSSQSIIDVLLGNSIEKGVRLIKSYAVAEISKRNDHFMISAKAGSASVYAKNVVLATGGYPKAAQFDWLSNLGHSINPPVPSLFTFNIPVDGLNHLKGLSVPAARVQIAGEKLHYEGPLLITHWGLSGPAVLKLSAWGARMLNKSDYQFTILINWIANNTEQSVVADIKAFINDHPKKIVISNPLFGLPQRLWSELMQRAGVKDQLTFSNVGQKSIHKMLEMIYRMPLTVSGKTTYKEEFVTSGGVRLEEIDPNSMESKKIQNLYFVGEILDIDGITGGFNFQSAWSTATVAADHIKQKINS